MWTLSLALAVVAPDSMPLAPARVSHVVGHLLVRGPRETSIAEVTTNAVIRPGDRLKTPYGSFVEVELSPGTFLHLAGGTVTVVDEVDRVLLVVVEKGAVAVMRGHGGEPVRVIALGGRVALEEGARCRVTLDPDELQVEVRLTEGYADLVTGAASERLRPGETVTYLPGATERGLWTEERDAFDNWVNERSQWLTKRLAPRDLSSAAVGASDLHDHGDWIQLSRERVWQPRVSPRWRPYLHGSWSWTEPWGWVWVPTSAWEYITHHYGHWRHTAAHGWIWVPGTEWRPAHVSWAVVGPWVAWAPVGFHHHVDPAFWVFADLAYFWFGGGCHPHRHPGQILDGTTVARHRPTPVGAPREELAPDRGGPPEGLLARRIRALSEPDRGRDLARARVALNPPRRYARTPIARTGRGRDWDPDDRKQARDERHLRQQERASQYGGVTLVQSPRVVTITRRQRPRRAAPANPPTPPSSVARPPEVARTPSAPPTAVKASPPQSPVLVTSERQPDRTRVRVMREPPVPGPAQPTVQSPGHPSPRSVPRRPTFPAAISIERSRSSASKPPIVIRRPSKPPAVSRSRPPAVHRASRPPAIRAPTRAVPAAKRSARPSSSARPRPHRK
jgi:hypothetical protein